MALISRHNVAVQKHVRSKTCLVPQSRSQTTTVIFFVKAANRNLGSEARVVLVQVFRKSSVKNNYRYINKQHHSHSECNGLLYIPF